MLVSLVEELKVIEMIKVITDPGGSLQSMQLGSYDVPVLGYRVNTCDRLRLWRADATEILIFMLSILGTTMEQ